MPPMRLKFGWKRPPVDGLDEVQDVLTVAEPVEGRRDRADLQTHLAEEQQERRDARQLGERGADPLRARRRLDVHQLLGGVDERHLVRERREPVDAVDQRRDLRVGAVLGELLVAAVHVPDDRVGRDDALAVEAHDEAQRPVRRRVLRPDVEHHVAGVELDVHLRVGEMPVDRRVDVDLRELARLRKIRGCGRHSRTSLGGVGSRVVGTRGLARHRLDVDETRPRLHLAREQREVLAQRMAFELGRKVEVTQARMTVEDDAVHLPRLALVPVGTGIHRHPRLRVRIVVVDVDLERDAELRLVRRLDMSEHLHAAGGTRDAERHLLGLHRRGGVARAFLGDRRRGQPVDHGDEREIVATELLLAELRGAAPRVGPHPHDEPAERAAVLDDRVAELRLQAREGRLGGFGERRCLRFLSCPGRGRRRGRVSQRPSAPGRDRRHPSPCNRPGCAAAAGRSPG